MYIYTYVIEMLSAIMRTRRKEKAGTKNKVYFSTVAAWICRKGCAFQHKPNFFLEAFFLVIAYLLVLEVAYAITFCIVAQKDLLHLTRFSLQVGIWIWGLQVLCCFLLSCISLLVTVSNGLSPSQSRYKCIHLPHLRLRQMMKLQVKC